MAPDVSGGFSSSPRPPGKKGKDGRNRGVLAPPDFGGGGGRWSTGQARMSFSKGCISWSVHCSNEIVTDGSRVYLR